VALGIGFDRVSVVDDRDTLGRIVLEQRWPHLRPGFDPQNPEDRRVAENWIVLALAGEIADAYHGGSDPDHRSLGARWDFRVATALTERLVAQPGQCDAFLEEMQRRANRFISEPLRWRQIAAVAARLGQVRVLDRQQVEQIMAEAAAAGEPGGTESASSG
jgi:hypothetical protein